MSLENEQILRENGTQGSSWASGHEVSSISPESAMQGYSRRAETHMGIRSTPRLITNTHQTRVTVLGLEAGGGPLQLPLFLDKRRKKKMKMQVANEQSSTFHFLLTTFSLTYESTRLKCTLRVTDQLLMDKGASLNSSCLSAVWYSKLSFCG